MIKLGLDCLYAFGEYPPKRGVAGSAVFPSICSAMERILPCLRMPLARLLFTTLCCILLAMTAAAQDAFITTWKTSTADESITIPIKPDLAGYNYSVDWGDGSTSTSQTGNATHNYAAAGIYTVTISGDFPAIQFGSAASADVNDQKLITVEQWGDQVWQSMHQAFDGCVNLTSVSVTDAPVFAPNCSLYAMFSRCTSFDGDLNHWDMTNVHEMQLMFSEASLFNGRIDAWDVSNVTTMEEMFSYASAFNQPIGGWNVSNVTNMRRLFFRATEFNQDIGTWDVSSVTNMDALFEGAAAFNQDIGDWNVSNVIFMQWMFQDAIAFNQDIGRWDVSSVSNMSSMFSRAIAFNQAIGGWDVSEVTDMSWMFSESKAFDQDLSDWNVTKVRKFSGMFRQAEVFNGDLSGWVFPNARDLMWMFREAKLFNRDLSGWDVSHVEGMEATFQGASSFNRDIGGWDVSQVNDMRNMLSNSGLSRENYDATLIGWAAQSGLQGAVLLGAQGLGYCAGADARQKLIDDFEWTIIDDGEAEDCGGGIGPADPDHFITIWNTEIDAGTGPNDIKIPAIGEFTYTWVDVNDPAVTGSGNGSGETIVTFPEPGSYEVRMAPTGSTPFHSIQFNYIVSGNDAAKLLEVKNWGTVHWSKFMFYGCSNLKVTATDIPDLSGVTDLSFAFGYSGIDVIPNINDWDVSTVLDMSNLFEHVTGFNQSLDNWDVSNVSTMSFMFDGASSFNQPLDSWDVRKLEDFSYMFRDASSFNQSLAAWQLASFVGGIASFYRSGMSCENFSYSLYSWAMNPNTNDGATLDGAGVTYSPDIAPYVDKLEEERNWTFQSLEEGTCSVVLPGRPIEPGPGNILYVDVNVNTAASGYTGAGDSWANAIPQLADALKWAREQHDGGSPGWTEAEPLRIFVAKGEYRPLYDATDGQYASDGGRDNSFVLVPHVRLYGGFDPSSGIETLADERILPIREMNVMSGTVLSGDLMGDDAPDIPITELTGHPSRLDNAHHVVMAVGDVGTALLDGFTIAGGNADGTEIGAVRQVYGYAIYNDDNGGGINIHYSSPTISHVVLVGNSAVDAGGGIDVYRSPAPTVNHAFFWGNRASAGGGFNTGESGGLLHNLVFVGNMAENGGGLYIGGSGTIISNVTIAGNSAGEGGGIFINEAAPDIANSIIWGNEAGGSTTSASASVYRMVSPFEELQPTFTNNLIGNVGGSDSWKADMGIDGGDNIDVDPDFVGITPGEAEFLQLAASSPAINAGNNQAYFDAGGDAAVDLDFAGHPRVYHFADGGVIDMGANEFQGEPLIMQIYVETWTGENFTLDVALSDAIQQVKQKIQDQTGISPDEQTLRFGGIPLEDGRTLADYGVAYGNTIQLSIATLPDARNVLYVNINVDRYAPGYTGAGNRWENAIPELVDALQWARDRADDWTETDPLQIWVAAGTYLPSSGGSFEMIDNVRIYGGFSGSEEALSERDLRANPTILQGNGSSVVRNPGSLRLSRSARLDGFTVTGGNSGEGGGIYNATDATFAHLIVRENTGTGSGGGIRNFASGLYYNVLITGNTSPLGAGFFTTVDESMPILVNVTSSGNTGDRGAEFYHEAGHPTVINSILFGNGIYRANAADEITMRHSLVQYNRSTANGNVDGMIHPLFADAANGDFSLLPTSAAINAGSNDAYLEFVGSLVEQSDLGGQPRLREGTIDLGAFESPYVRTLVPTGILYVNNEVDQEAAGYTGDGSSWEQALPDLAGALRWAKENATQWTEASPLQIWVAVGTHTAFSGKSFEMVNHVQIYGGFNGTESRLSERDPSIAGGRTDLRGNGNSVIYNAEAAGLTRHARLDGFHISGGQAAFGGGIFNAGDAIFGNLTISDNSAESAGGGVYNSGSPLLHDVFISANTSPQGAEFYTTESNSAPVLVNVSAVSPVNDGAAASFYLDAGNPVIRNSVIYGNGVYGFSDATDLHFSFVEGLTSTENGNIPDSGFPFLDMSFMDIQAFMIPTSWTINRGSNEAYTNLVGPLENRWDVLGRARLQQGVIDIGAMETPYKQAMIPDNTHTVYVNQSVDQQIPGFKGDGSSWAHAVPELADALQWAYFYQLLNYYKAQYENGDGEDVPALKVFVAKGNYTPRYAADGFVIDGTGTIEGGRRSAFVLPLKTELYGGFAGTEQHVAERDWATHTTILSGDLAGDDDPNDLTLNRGDNADHVVIAAGELPGMLIDGFTVTGGNASGDGENVSLNGESISSNFGGGMVIAGAEPFIANMVISGNAAQMGGGLYAVEGSPTIVNSLFSGNAASYAGGGVLNNNSNSRFINTTISGNLAQEGGGLYYVGEEVPSLHNSVVYGNSSSQNFADPMPATITYSLVEGLAADMENGNVDGTDTELDATDVFIAPLAPGLSVGGDYRPSASSPAVNAGNNGTYPGDVTTALDLAGRSRLTGASIDMGAYESASLRIVSVAEIPAVITPFGTSLSEIAIPEPFAVEATLDDGSTAKVDLPVDPAQWSLVDPGSSFDGNRAGTYVFAVPLILPDDEESDFTNPDSITARLTVTVSKGVPELVTNWNGNSVDVTDGLTLTYGDIGQLEVLTNDPDGLITVSLGMGDNVVDLDDLDVVSAQLAGTAILTVAQGETDNFGAGSVEIPVTVARKAITIVPTADQGKVYGDDEPTAYGYELADGSTLSFDDALADIVSEASRQAGEDVGSYAIELAFAGDKAGNYEIAFDAENGAFLISPLTITVVAEDKSKVFGTADPALTYTLSPALVGGDSFTGDLRRNDGENAGTYPITQGDLSLGDNYNIVFEPGTLTITPAGYQGVVFNNGSFVYDGTKHTLELTGDVPAGATVVYEINGEPGNHATDVGTYEIIARINGGDNYEDLELAATLTIIPAKISGITFDDTSATYDGTEHRLNLAGNLPVGASVTYTIGGEPGNGATDAGIYAVMAMIDGGANHQDLALTATLKIIPLEVAVIAANQNKTFGAEDPELTYSFTPELIGEDTFTGSLNREAGEDVGDYAITRGTLSASDNYNILFEAGSLTIGRATIEGIKFEDVTYIYQGAAWEILLEGDLPAGTKVKYSNNRHAEVGVYEATATISGGNYETLTLRATLTITPAERSIDFQPLPEKTYGDGAFDAEATASSGEVVSYTSSDPAVAEIDPTGRITINGAGTTTIKATVPANGNYSNRPEVSRILMVSKSSQIIEFAQVEQVHRDAGSVQLEVSASSGLPVFLSIDDPEVATLEGSRLHVHRLGTVRITANQGGDGNYQAADPVVITVRVIDPEAELPMRVSKVVSPNGDGINEYLLIEGIKDYPENKVVVFNRNGTVLYEAKGYNNGSIAFRGVSTGQMLLPAGTYFYVAEIKVNGTWKYEKGWFVLRY